MPGSGVPDCVFSHSLCHDGPRNLIWVVAAWKLQQSFAFLVPWDIQSHVAVVKVAAGPSFSVFFSPLKAFGEEPCNIKYICICIFN
jgi:hypothetical protein